MHEKLFKKSQELVPGGVHSPVRSFKGLEMSPRFIEHAKGAYLVDIENRNYIDFCMSFGPLILGHQDPELTKILQDALARGWTYGACEPYSLQLCQFIIEKIPFIQQIRLVNSGTEAVMTALRLARGYTQRNKIIKFNGCYHGHSDAMLIKAGSGLAGTPEASSLGVPSGVTQDTIVLELNDFTGIKECFKKYDKQIAAVIIEPLPANNGLLIQNQEFLQFLREITAHEKALLIFDEVISGFRTSFGGMAQLLDITPDLVTYGKIIGGGLPVGAVAGPKEIMQKLAPIGGVYQAGTLSANPLAMVAGLHTLQRLTSAAFQQLRDNTNMIVAILEKWMQEYKQGVFNKFQITHFQSLFWISSGTKIQRACDIPADLQQTFSTLFKTLLEKGIYLAPNAYEVGFVSLAHGQDVWQDLEQRLWSN